MGSHAAKRRIGFFRALRSTRARAALALGTLVGLGSISTMAYWTDSATVEGGTFTAGTLDIKLGSPAVDNNPPQFTTDFAMTDMVPGSTKDAIIKVSNVGTVPFTYTITASATNSGAGSDQLGGAIRIATYRGSCGGTVLQGSVTPSAVNISRPALGVAPAANAEDLCFRAELPGDANTALQGKSTVVTLTFAAKQVGAP
ncbi:hypothetical protein ASG90_17340 [Nocardioides sp. Soil797]|nr:hypothetical protein ASG90_17340 [Nocardioides sp. Soil797]